MLSNPTASSFYLTRRRCQGDRGVSTELPYRGTVLIAMEFYLAIVYAFLKCPWLAQRFNLAFTSWSINALTKTKQCFTQKLKTEERERERVGRKVIYYHYYTLNKSLHVHC